MAMRKWVFLFSFLGSCLANGAFANGVHTAISVSCDQGSKIKLKISNFHHLLDMSSGGSFGYGIFFQTPGKPEISLYNNAFHPSDSHGDFPQWYAVFASDGERLIGPIMTNEFAPLPSTTNTSNIRVFEVPQRIYNRSSWRTADNPPFLNIFLDPRVMSRSDFVRIADCLESHRDAFNHALSDPGFSAYFKPFYHPLRLGGVVLGPAPYGDSNYLETVKNIWGAGNHLKEYISLPAKDKFTLYPGEAAKGRFGGYYLTIFIDDSGVPRIKAGEKTLTFPSNGGYSNEEPKISGFRNEVWYINIYGSCMKNDLQGCPGEIRVLAHNLDRSITFYSEVRGLDTVPGPIHFPNQR